MTRLSKLQKIRTLSAYALVAFALCGIGVAETTAQSGGTPELRARLIERAITQFDLNDERCEVSVRNGLDRMPAIDEFTLRTLTKSRAKGMVPVIVEYTTFDGINGRAQITLSIRVFDSALVASSRLARGQELNSRSVVCEWRDVTDFPGAPLRDLTAATGYRLRRNIPAGNVITASALEVIPDVEYGDEVTIEFSVGALSLRAVGSALEAGAVGETVRVRNITSKSIIKATITAPGVVSAKAHR